MTGEHALRILSRVHGHLGWLSAAALVHPAIVLLRPRRRAVLSVVLATALCTVSGVLGATIYPRYRMLLKLAIFRSSPSIGWLFERKEHLAVGAVAFAWVGLLTHLAVPRAAEERTRSILARTAHVAFVASATLTTLVAAIGVVVAAHRSF